MLRDQGLQPLQTLGLHFLRYLIVPPGGWRAGPRRIHERIRAGKADFVDQRQRVTEFAFSLAGKTDDEVRREGEISPALAQACDDPEIVLARMPAIHRRQNAIGT